MKNNKETNEIAKIKKIILCLGVLLAVKLIISIMGNVNVIPSCYADDSITDGIVTYTVESRGAKAIINCNNNNISSIKNLTIKHHVNVPVLNGYKTYNVYAFEIVNHSAGCSSFSFESLQNLEELNIPINLLIKYKNFDVFKGLNNLQKLTLCVDLVNIVRGDIQGAYGKEYYNETEKEFILKDLGDFTHLTNLKKVNIEINSPEGITLKIGDRLFRKFEKLENVSISVYNQLGNENKKNVNINLNIGVSAFSGCTKLNEIYYYKNIFLSKVDNCAFYNCKKLEKIGSFSEGYSCFGKGLKYIGDDAFAYCKNLDMMLGKESKLEYLGERAFQDSGIISANITMTGENKEIKAGTFLDCYRLRYIKLNNITKIGESAFYGCYSSGSRVDASGSVIPPIIIPHSVREIDSMAFNNCYYFDIVISSSVTKISKSAFSEIKGNGIIKCARDSEAEKVLKANGIEYQTYDDTYTYAGIEYRLNGYYEAESIKYTGTGTGKKEIPSKINVDGVSYKVTKIGENSFKNGRMNWVVIPNTVRTIEKNAFLNCSNLKRVDIPKSINFIDKLAFNNSKNAVLYAYINIYLKNYMKDTGIKFWDFNKKTAVRFYYTDILYELKTNNTVKAIKYEGTGTGIKKVYNPKCAGKTYVVDEIAEGAFNGTSIGGIDLRKATGIKKIGKEAFANCKNLKDAYILSNVKEIDNSAFNNCSNLKIIYGEKNSSVQSFAKSKGIKFKVLNV